MTLVSVRSRSEYNGSLWFYNGLRSIQQLSCRVAKFLCIWRRKQNWNESSSSEELLLYMLKHPNQSLNKNTYWNEQAANLWELHKTLRIKVYINVLPESGYCSPCHGLEPTSRPIDRISRTNNYCWYIRSSVVLSIDHDPSLPVVLSGADEPSETTIGPPICISGFMERVTL